MLDMRDRIRARVPVLPDQVLAEVVVRPFLREPEPGRLVDAAGGDEDVIGVERERLVAGAARPRFTQASTSRRPAPGPRALGSTKSRRSRPTSSLSLTRNTQPTGAPFRVAIQQRSAAGSKSRAKFATISATSASNSSFQPNSAP